MNKKLPILLDLFLTFMRVGAVTFGGGYVMISIIENICVEQKKWITHDEMMNITVIAESTPGPIAINCATYVGYKMAGLIGAVFATVGIVFPSFVIIFIISLFMDAFMANVYVAKAFKGIKAAVGLLIIEAGIGMFKKMNKSTLSVILFAFGLVAMLLGNIFALNLSSITLMITAGIVSLLVSLVKKEVVNK